MMSYSSLISASQLGERLSDPDWVIVDCRFSLDDTARGRRDYETSHIPGALYAHLDDDLSGQIVPGQSGRHPLPNSDVFAKMLGDWGIGSSVQVVAYDDSGGAIAARLWWMLRWLGHDAVAVLDGGWPQWLGQRMPTRGGVETQSGREFMPSSRPELLVDVATVEMMLTEPGSRVLDSRSADRYRGENETIDPVAGHIPGAVCAPYQDNLGEDGLFHSKEALRDRFESLLGDIPAGKAAFYCGSGVSAAHNLLAMEYAGLGEAPLYVGSWSEWITDPERAVASGE